MTHHTTDHLTIISRLGELYFDGDYKLQREFYEYLTGSSELSVVGGI